MGERRDRAKEKIKGAENPCDLLCRENCHLLFPLPLPEHCATWRCRKIPKEVKLLDLIRMWETQTVKECAGKV